MASSTSQPPSVDLQHRPARDKPSPLRIIKRHRSADAITATRASSSNTDGSAPEPVNGGDHLTIMKRRSERCHLRGALVDGQDDPFGETTTMREVSASEHPKCNSWDDFMFLGNGLAGSKTLNIRKTRPSRPSLFGPRGLSTQTCRNPSRPSMARAPIPFARDISPMSSQLDVADQDYRSPSSLSGTYPHILDAPARQPSPRLSMRNGSSTRTSCVLCPHVSVTADCTTLEAGQQSIWAAIEVSGRLSQILERPPGEHLGIVTGAFMDHELDRFFEHGCLYDLTVDISPMEGSTIINVLREQGFPTTIYAGSSVLLLAQIRLGLDGSPSPRRNTHVRQKSDELIEDLEIQLGSSEVTYMQIRVSYAHSAFPEYFRPDTTTGVSSMSSRMETKATASLKRHNTLSPWSPRPAPSPNPLFPLIERHWGADKARDAMQQILNQRFTPRKPAKAGADLSPDVSRDHLEVPPPPPKHAPPPVPTRQTSLQRDVFARRPMSRKGSTAELRQRGTSRGTYSFETDRDHGSIDSRSRGSPSSNGIRAGAVSSETSGSPRRRRSLGIGGLKGLMPNFSDFTLDSKPMREKSFRGSAAGSKRKKDLGRWNWASWF